MRSAGSSGKDSTALWGWAINDSGYPRETIRGSFCDTGNEYNEVYEQIAKLDEYGQARGIHPIRTLRANNPKWTWNTMPLFLALAIWKGRFPSARARFCTQHLKIIPTAQYVQELQLEGADIVAHSGVRSNESIERSLLAEWDDGQFGCRVRRPLLKWTIADVWEAHKRYKLPINALYFAGRKRVGCRLCVMSKKQDVRLTLRFKPWVIELYRKWETAVGQSLIARGIGCDYSSFFHRNTVPERMRTRKVITRHSGEMMVATIDDVARWSLTERGGIQGAMDFMFAEDDFNADDAAAPCQSGYCE